MGQYTRTRRRISNSSINGSGGGRTELDSGGSGGHNFSCLNKGISRRSKDCDKIVCCSSSASTTTTTTSATSTSAGNRSTISSCDSADEALWTRSKKTTIIPQRKGQRPLQLCVGNCPNGPTPPLSPSSSSSTLLTMTAGRRGGGGGDDDNDGGSTTDLSSSCARSSPQSHSSSRWKHYRRLLAFRNFYHHRHSLRWDFFGHASVSFTLLCGSILILLGSRNDLLGQCVRGDEISEADKPIPVEHVEGVLKSQVKLPCNVSVPTRDDKLHMVLWFRDRDGEPIYRYDVRDKSPADAKTWSLENRLFFQAVFDPAHLSIQNLELRDEGVYRCRVDFKNSPTRNIRVNLTIVVPPDQPVIYDTNGIVTMKHVGPYNEGSDLILTCEVSGGRPMPKLTWWLGNTMIDGNYHDRQDGILTNRIVFPRLGRNHLNSEFVCQASNTNQALPPSTKVVVNLNLRPLKTTITTTDSFLLAEKRYDMECITAGSRPPAVITWWKNGRQISQLLTVPPSDDKNITKSILHLIPTIEDDGKILMCRGDNPWIPGSVEEDRLRLNVYYPPRVYLKLGDNLIPDDIKEGDDVYFECSVTSNPPHTRMNWFHEGREVRHNTSQRVVTSHNRLVLQKVTRHTAGNYSCSATNSQGSSQSNILSLRVKFVPTCKSNTEGLIGAMKKETVQVICEMAADPPKVEFYWTFNNSGVEVIHVMRARFSYKGTQSVLNYTPITEMDYGTLACWGVNDVGKGMDGPCIFQIVSAGRPFPPRNCTIFNHTEDSLNIACVEGFDGGLPQHFVLEVIDFTAKKIKLNASSKMPSFSVEGMEPHVVFRFIVYAVNAKGRSEPFSLDGITFRGVAKLTSETNGDEMELKPLYAVIAGCFVVLIVFLIVAIIAVWKRSRRRKPPVAKAYKRDSENSNNFQTGDTALTKIDQNSVEDIGNPDVVPNKSGTTDRSGGIRGFIRIHKTPPARRRKKDLEVKNNGETVALTLADTPDGELHRNHHNHHRPSILTSANHVVSSAARESRI